MTGAHRLVSIRSEGLRGGAYLTDDEGVATSYAETVRDEGGGSVAVKVDIGLLDPASLDPGRPSLQEPVTAVLGMDEDEVAEAREKSGGTWCNSLASVWGLPRFGGTP